MRVERPLPLILLLALVIGTVVAIELVRPEPPDDRTLEVPANASERLEAKRASFDRAHDIAAPSGFVNAETVSLNDSVGEKVVLLEFWTYTCINCQRTAPYLQAWHEKYADDGLVVIGVHSPEFGFEERRSNVVAAVERLGIEYPVVLDNDFATWRAYDNRFWPERYLIGVDGFVRSHHVGEGGYADTEQRIQALLRERARVVGEAPSADLDSAPVTIEDGHVRFGRVYTRELYFGADRNDWLGDDSGVPGRLAASDPGSYERDRPTLVGTWNVTDEYVESVGTGPGRDGSSLVLPYRAGRANLVLGTTDGATVRVAVDGEPVGPDIAGEDVTDGRLRVTEARLYNLVDGDFDRRRLRVTVLDGTLRVYTAMFGR